jgi:hypothetical protein
LATDFHERFGNTVQSPPSDRACAFAIAALLLAVAFAFRDRQSVVAPLIVTACLLAVLGAARPSWLHGLAVVWVALGGLLHRVMGPLVMGMLFFGVITPLGRLMRLWFDPLLRQWSEGTESYWVEVPQRDDLASMHNQF